jgi:hypothetical protein
MAQRSKRSQTQSHRLCAYTILVRLSTLPVCEHPVSYGTFQKNSGACKKMIRFVIFFLCCVAVSLPSLAQTVGSESNTFRNVVESRITNDNAGTAISTTNSVPDVLSQLPELLPREREVELALSAAPEHLRKDAAVFVLQRGGYVKARDGSNGFTCLVEREGARGTAPVCFDREGSETTLLMVFRKAQLVELGKGSADVERIIDDEYRLGKLIAPRKPGIAYMLSTEFKMHDHQSGKMVAVFPPHIMFYAPYMKNSDIGARAEDNGSRSRPFILNEGKAYAYIIVVQGAKQ